MHLLVDHCTEHIFFCISEVKNRKNSSLIVKRSLLHRTCPQKNPGTHQLNKHRLQAPNH